jgi:hypothetical protein
MTLGLQELLFLFIALPIMILIVFKLIVFLLNLLFKTQINFWDWSKKIVKYYYIVVIIILIITFIVISMMMNSNNPELIKLR